LPDQSRWAVPEQARAFCIDAENEMAVSQHHHAERQPIQEAGKGLSGVLAEWAIGGTPFPGSASRH
jgi:hypothetical protein